MNEKVKRLFKNNLHSLPETEFKFCVFDNEKYSEIL